MLRSLLLGVAFAGLMLVQAAPVEAQRGIPINIESVPPGALVYVDSPTASPLGQTPLRNVRIPRGTHTLIFRLANHEEARLEVNVRRRRETFRAVLRALGTIEVSAANDAARGATVRVDGRTVGGGPLAGTPVRVTDLQPGRHQVSATREGHVEFEQWVEVGGGQLVRVPILMERAAPDTGSILIGGVPGSAVFVDGTPRGATPTVIDDVAVGAHTIEVRPPRGQPYTTTVTVVAGQRATVTPPTDTGGTLRVLTNVPGAIVRIDGEPVGAAPAVRDGLTPGEHIVEAQAEGYQRAQQVVTIEAGQQRVVSLELEQVAGDPGQIVVRSNIAGASVTIDGEDRGVAPVVVTPEPGDHAIIVRADGYQEFSTTCETRSGTDCDLDVRLQPQQVRVSVAVQPGVRDAEILIDGEVVGPVPYDGTLPAGSHVMEVRAPGYEVFRQQVLLTPSSDVRPFDVTLPEVTDGLSPEERQRLAQTEEVLRAATATHSAAPLMVNHASMDLSVGWPYLFELRLNVGLLPFLDAGFATRIFERMIEFEGRARLGFRPLQQLSVAAQARVGGAIGFNQGFSAPGVGPNAMNCMAPDDTGTGDPPFTERAVTTPCPLPNTDFSLPMNSFFFSAELLGSLHFSDQGAFTLFFGLDFSSDEYAGHPLRGGTYLDYQRGGDVYCEPSAPGSSDLNCSRQNRARARLGGALELVLTRNWNVWFLLEGILSAAPRNVYGNLLGIETNDTQFYFRVGTTYKF